MGGVGVVVAMVVDELNDVEPVEVAVVDGGAAGLLSVQDVGAAAAGDQEAGEHTGHIAVVAALAGLH